MIRSESIEYDPDKVIELKKLVSRGEGLHLEFKLKAAFPEKIVKEIIAFANTDGGTLLVGVDDNGSIPGLKFPEEESLLIHDAIRKYCRPGVGYHESIIAISDNRFVLSWRIPASELKPHFYVEGKSRISFVRQLDRSIRASRELSEIIRRRKSRAGVQFTYGAEEQKIMNFLVNGNTLTLRECARLTGLNRFIVSRKLIRLVLARVLNITPTEKGDIYSHA